MSHSSRSSSHTTFVSTAIPYVNAAPHLGHALEFVLADAVVRTRRQQGIDVWFTSGSDDNSAKNATAAAAHAINTQTWVDKNAAQFEHLLERLSIRPNAFVRTSANPSHKASVHKLWRLCLNAGDIYPATYEGHYCVGCERFFRASEIPPDGRCPEHGIALEAVTERNLFFRLSRHTARLTELIEQGQLRIVPESARRETLALLAAGLDDISISRQVKPGHPAWGLPAPSYPDPNLPEQTIWVWFDALTNYLSSLDFGNNHERYQRYWVNAKERIHVVGKGIGRFHTTLWPALLLSAGLPLPTEVLVHGYLTIDGAKISKSGGNAVDPFRLIDEYGCDAIRYFLLRHVHPTKDGDFSNARLAAAYRGELADQFGNLVSRLTALVVKQCDGRVPTDTPIDETIESALTQASAHVANLQSRFAHHEALGTLFTVLATLNRYFDANAPWKLAKAANAGDSDAAHHLRQVLTSTSLGLVQVAALLEPYLPDACERTRAALGWDGKEHQAATPDAHSFTTPVQPASQLFPKERS